MALQQNSYAVGNGTAITSASQLAGSGDTPSFGGVTGTAPVLTSINVTGHTGQMIRVVAGASDAQSHSFAGSSLQGAARLKVLVDSAGGRVPVTAAYTLYRGRNSTTNVFKAMLTLDLKVYLYSGDGTVLFGKLNNDTPLTDGLYWVEVLWSINATTAAAGAFSARLLNASGAVVGNTVNGIAANLGTTPLTTLSWIKPETVASSSPNGIVVGMPAADFGATAYIGPPASNNPPVASDPAGQNVVAGNPFSIAAVATDDGSIVSYAWSLVTAESSVTQSSLSLTGLTTDTVSGTSPAAGNVAVLQCVITDNQGLSTTIKAGIRSPLAGTATARPLPLDGTAVGTWATVGGSASAGAALADESDATYLESPTLTSTETSKRQRWQPTAARASNVIKLRLWTDTGTATAIVRLYDGTTVRQTWTQALTTTPTEYQFTPSAATLAAIADWSSLYVEVAGVG